MLRDPREKKTVSTPVGTYPVTCSELVKLISVNSFCLGFTSVFFRKGNLSICLFPASNQGIQPLIALGPDPWWCAIYIYFQQQVVNQSSAGR